MCAFYPAALETHTVKSTFSADLTSSITTISVDDATAGREQDFAEISRRMYDEIRSSKDPRDHVEDG